MELPCKELHCELLKRLERGVAPSDFTMTSEEMREKAHELLQWFTDREISPYNALGILETLKSACWEVIARMG